MLGPNLKYRSVVPWQLHITCPNVLFFTAQPALCSGYIALENWLNLIFLQRSTVLLGPNLKNRSVVPWQLHVTCPNVLFFTAQPALCSGYIALENWLHLIFPWQRSTVLLGPNLKYRSVVPWQLHITCPNVLFFTAQPALCSGYIALESWLHLNFPSAIDRLAGAKFEISFSCTLTTSYNMPKCTFLYRSACFVLRLHSTWELAQSKFFLAIDRLAGAKFEKSFCCTLTTSCNMPKCTFLYRSACFVLRLHSTWELAPFNFPSAIDRLAGAKFEISFSCTLTTSYNMPKCTFLYRSACFVLRLHSTWELAQSKFS